MANLRPVSQRRVIAIFGESYFEEHHFDVVFRDAKDLFAVRFVLVPEYKFAVRYSTESYPKYHSTEVPGIVMAEVESYTYDNFNSLLKGLQRWIERILGELRESEPFVEQMEEQLRQLRSELESQINTHVENQNQHFTSLEIEDLGLRLDEVIKKVEALWQKHEMNEDELEDIKSHMKEMKTDLQKFSKGVWYRVAGGKLLSIVRKVSGSKEGQELMATATKQLISGPPD